MNRIVASALSCLVIATPLAAAAPPNVVIIFADDQGYGDLGCYGSETISTPNLDRLAREGRKFTSFMVASPVCSPSRAALLTGCYSKRVGMHRHVLFPTSTTGLAPSEHTLADLGLAENTYVIYTSDNGPWLPFKHHGGSAGPLRDGKGTTFEGGQRVPCLIRGPGIPPGTVCDALTGTIDVLPTLAALTGGELPPGRTIDGLDVSRLWRGEAESSPREEFLYFSVHGEIEGIRQGTWKLLVKRPRWGKQVATDATASQPQVLLFDLEADLGEQTNLAEEHPDLVTWLRERMLALDGEITANARPQWTRDPVTP